MKKKVLALVLIAVLLCACGDNNTSKSEQGNGESNVQKSGDVISDSQQSRQELRESIDRAQSLLRALENGDQRTSDEVMHKTDEHNVPTVDEIIGADANSGSDYENNSTETTSSDAPPKDIKATKGAVLLDQDGIKITFQSIEDYKSMSFYRINLLIENNSNLNITVQARDCAVNGFMIGEPFAFSSEVHSGMKDNSTMDFFDKTVNEKAGISDVSEIKELTLRFHSFEAGNYSGDSNDYDLINLIF